MEQTSTNMQENKPSILFASPMNILDITSGAALSMRTFLAALASRGLKATALQATLFDSTHGGEHVIQAGETQKDKKILRSKVLGVEHYIVKTESTFRPKMTCDEQERYLNLFRSFVKKSRPDMIILWGGMLLEMTIMREAREAGIPVIFYLVNGGYKDKSTFRYVSLIVTDTQATADLYKERHNLDCKPIGKFIDSSLIKAPIRKPEYITFINPSFEKGVNVFMPMAKLAAIENPEIKFLVVQSRGRWAMALHVLKFKPEDFPNVKIIGHQKDMRPVYACTKALLLPSTWHESGARVIPEALINEIPIIASNTGGSAELVGAGGIILDLPEAVKEKKGEPADESTARSWLEQVKRVWYDESYYADLHKKASIEAVKHDTQNNVDRFLAVAQPIVNASKQVIQKKMNKNVSLLSVTKKALERKKAKNAARNSRKNNANFQR